MRIRAMVQKAADGVKAAAPVVAGVAFTGAGLLTSAHAAEVDFSSQASAAVDGLTSQIGSMAGLVLPVLVGLVALGWLGRSIQRRGRSGV